jgi:menaquinone-dependent protoporphyrinogen oxidase
MEPVVLVTYATRSGSTKEVAQAIAEMLRQEGLVVTVQSVREVKSLEQYGAVLLGAALYMGRLHKHARQFLSSHLEGLMKMPVAMFVLGPVEKTEKDWMAAREQLEKELANYPWLSPVAKQIVGGKFDPSKMGFPFNLILKKMQVKDALDWPAIRALAHDLSATFNAALQR